jgi:Holliday junction resolvase RusA-like endonuclease
MPERIEEIIQREDFYLDVSEYPDKLLREIEEAMDEIEEENPLYEIEFTIPFEPKPAPRPRGRISGRFLKKKPKVVVENPFIQWYDPGADDKKEISEFIKTVLPKGFEIIGGECYLFMEIYKPILASFNRKEKFLAEAKILRPEKKPDTDNYAKTVMDAMSKLVWSDDGSVVQNNVEKYYSSKPRMEVTLQFRLKKICEK